MKLLLDNRTFALISRGIFAVNKQKNFTSAEVVDFVKGTIMKDIKASGRHYLKVGHGGTLDKTATGVLVIGLCNGCKLLTDLLKGEKTYVVTGKLGTATTTYNEQGRETNQAGFSHVAKELLASVLPSFQGKIMQKPPPYSALKRGGLRLSDIVRSGEEVTTDPREVECHSIEITSFEPPYFGLRVECGGGFYVRSLVHDLGIAVGSFAHVVDLRRVRQGPFEIGHCLEMDTLNLEGILRAVDLSKRLYSEVLDRNYSDYRTYKSSFS